MKKESIFLVIPRGEALRNFVYDNRLRILREKYEVVVISVIPSEEIRKEASQNCDFLYEIPEIETTYKSNYFRELLDTVHNMIIWTESSKDRFMHRDLQSRQSISKFLKRRANLVLAKIFKSKKGIDFLQDYVFKLYQKKELKEVKAIFERHKPILLFNTSHVHNRNALDMVYYGKSLGIKMVTFVFSWDNLTSQGRIMPLYDHYFVWNEHIKKDLLKYYSDYVTEKQVTVSGTPQFDKHLDKSLIKSKEEFFEIIGADINKKTILYSTGMDNHMPFEEYFVEFIYNEYIKKRDDVQLLVRVYPKDKSGRFDVVKEKYPEILFPVIPWDKKFLTPLKDDLWFLPNMLKHVDAGLNVSSTISLELCMFDTPVINIAYKPLVGKVDKFNHISSYVRYYEYEHYVPIVNSGAVEVVRNNQELIKALDENLANPSKRHKERKAMLDWFFGPYLDGKAYIRVSEKILELLEKK